MVDQVKVLKNLLDFFKKLHPTKFEVKFINATMDLVNAGDIEESVYINFCKANGIDGEDPKEVKPFNSWTSPKTKPKDYGTSGCGGDKPYIPGKARGRDYGLSSC